MSTYDLQLTHAHTHAQAPWRRGVVSPLAMSRVDRVLVGFTVGRLALVPLFTLTFLSSPAATAVALVAFIAADIYDGVLARRHDADGPFRRAVDSGVDRIGIDLFFVSAFVTGAIPVTFLILLLARDAYCASLCGWMMLRRGVAIKADGLYRVLNLSIAAWALAAPWLTNTQRSAGIGAILVFSLVVAADLTRGVRRVLAAEGSVRGVVIPAGDLRR
jgi:phosphatidylglycerophosphate synthase